MGENDCNQVSWSNALRRILAICSINIPIPLNRMPVMEANKRIFTVVSERLSTLYIQQWRAVINNQTAGGCKGNKKLRTYCKFKDDFSFSSYLALSDPRLRSIFTKLRIGSHKLAIETGRHRRPVPIEASKRLCTFCDSREVEDEFHFVLCCAAWHETRYNFLSEIEEICDSKSWSEGFKFIFFMSGGFGDIKLAVRIGTYLQKMWDVRFTEG